MATDRFPNRNVNMPMPPGAVQAFRDRTAPRHTVGPPRFGPSDGRGSRREVAPGEFVDDRVIVQGGPSSPSEDSPPDLVTLGKPIEFSGRMLSPAKEYQMVGAACTEIKPAIIDAVEIGDIPADPNSPPS